MIFLKTTTKPGKESNWRKMFKSPAVSIFYGGILIVLALAGIYFLFDTWLDDYDRCDPLICTEGYPCFEQGDCGPSPEL